MISKYARALNNAAKNRNPSIVSVSLTSILLNNEAATTPTIMHCATLLFNSVVSRMRIFHCLNKISLKWYRNDPANSWLKSGGQCDLRSLLPKPVYSAGETGKKWEKKGGEKKDYQY